MGAVEGSRAPTTGIDLVDKHVAGGAAGAVLRPDRESIWRCWLQYFEWIGLDLTESGAGISPTAEEKMEEEEVLIGLLVSVVGHPRQRKNVQVEKMNSMRYAASVVSTVRSAYEKACLQPVSCGVAGRTSVR